MAAHTLGRFGTKAQAAIPALSNLLQDENPDIRFVAAQALGEIGTEAVVPALTKALQDKDENVRVSAAVAFQQIGSVAQQAKPVLIAALWDGNWYVRSKTAATLSKLGLEQSDIIDLLEPWRGDLKPAEGAFLSLMIAIDSHVRKKVQDVPFFFIKALQNKDPKVRESAVIALGEVGLTTPGSAQFLDTSKVLLKSFDDQDLKVRGKAINALKLVLYGFSNKRFEAATQLSPYRQGIDRVKSKLLEIVVDQSSAARQSAMESLWYILKLNDDSRQITDALVVGLKDQDPNVRLSAADSLGLWLWHVKDQSDYSMPNSSRGETLRRVFSALTESLYDLDEEVRREAITALRSTESGTKVVLSTLAQIIDESDKNVELRQSAIAMCWTTSF
ncbi:MAG: HEAT repeat domain-containing protein, partial [Phormidesmis sp. CAN_BIN44]|nr:HEAT repeat domain-containing protein [Phormidesmis sp. CAN_BIN44]